MKKQLKLFTAIYIIFLLLTTISSCGGDCGPFPNRFSIKSFDWHVASIELTENYYISADISNNKVNYNKYAIKVNAEIEQYFANRLNLSLINSAYANDCDEAPPITDDKITNIEIIVNQDFNQNFSTGDNISSKFIIGYIEEESFQSMRLVDYINSNPKVSSDFFLLLDEAPLENGDYTFTVKITMKGKTLDYFEFTTDLITITNN